MHETRKYIYVGSLNLENEPTTPLTSELMKVICELPEKEDDLGRLLVDTGRLKLVT
jgi:hypothetical protein